MYKSAFGSWIKLWSVCEVNPKLMSRIFFCDTRQGSWSWCPSIPLGESFCVKQIHKYPMQPCSALISILAHSGPDLNQHPSSFVAAGARWMNVCVREVLRGWWAPIAALRCAMERRTVQALCKRPWSGDTVRWRSQIISFRLKSEVLRLSTPFRCGGGKLRN